MRCRSVTLSFGLLSLLAFTTVHAERLSLGYLQGRINALEAENAAQQDRIDTLEAGQAEQDERLNTLEADPGPTAICSEQYLSGAFILDGADQITNYRIYGFSSGGASEVKAVRNPNTLLVAFNVSDGTLGYQSNIPPDITLPVKGSCFIAQ